MVSRTIFPKRVAHSEVTLPRRTYLESLRPPTREWQCPNQPRLIRSPVMRAAFLYLNHCDSESVDIPCPEDDCSAFPGGCLTSSNDPRGEGWGSRILRGLSVWIARVRCGAPPRFGSRVRWGPAACLTLPIRFRINERLTVQVNRTYFSFNPTWLDESSCADRFITSKPIVRLYSSFNPTFELRSQVCNITSPTVRNISFTGSWRTWVLTLWITKTVATPREAGHYACSASAESIGHIPTFILLLFIFFLRIYHYKLR